MISPELRSTLETRYCLGSVSSAEILEGGYWNRVLRVETGAGTFVLRISHPATPVEGAAYEHALMQFMRRDVAQVPRPIPARDGSTYFLWEGRVISLFPFMPGCVADRERAVVRAEAARILARIHRAALQYPDRSSRPGYPSLRDLDWNENRLWSWLPVRAFLTDGLVESGRAGLDGSDTEEAAARREIADRLPQIEEDRARLRMEVARLAASGRPLHFAPIHGDYYRGNLLVEDDRVSAVLDWEECHPDWLAGELGRALWEFCKSATRQTLHADRARDFLRAYREAGGPVPESDFDLLIPLNRCVRLIEVLFALDEARRGEPWDAAYTLGNLRALERLESGETPEKRSGTDGG